jgi:hypothetical protein
MDGDFDTGNVRYKSRERYSSVGLIPSVCGVHKALNVSRKRGAKNSPFLFVCSKIIKTGKTSLLNCPSRRIHD